MARRKRREFSPQFKFDAVMELLTETKPPGQICRERDINDKLLYRWKQEFIERGPGMFAGQSQPDPTGELEGRIAELERLAGRLALENEILKNASSWREAHQRKNGR